MPVEDKAYRVHSMGDGAFMHLNCAYNYWQQYRKQRGYVPVCDINVESDAVYDMFLEEAAESRCNLDQHEEVAGRCSCSRPSSARESSELAATK